MAEPRRGAFTGYRLCRRPLQHGGLRNGWLGGWLAWLAGWDWLSRMLARLSAQLWALTVYYPMLLAGWQAGWPGWLAGGQLARVLAGLVV